MKRRDYGFTLLELLVVMAILAIFLGLLLPAVQQVRAASAKLSCQNNMRQLAIGLHSYHDRTSHLPPGLSVLSERKRYPYLGWQARILPDLEQSALWAQVDEAFQSDPDPSTFYGHLPHQQLQAKVVPAFTCPSDYRLPGPRRHPSGFGFVAYTSYLGVIGQRSAFADGVIFLDSMTNLAHVTDGTSNTILLGERPPSTDLRYGWWYRGWGQAKDGSAEMILGAAETNVVGLSCPAGPYAFTSGRFDNQCDMFHFWSPHPGGANFAFCDGSVHFLRYSANDVLPALATRAGGEVVGDY